MQKKKKSRKDDNTNLKKLVLATAILQLVQAVIDLLDRLLE